MINRIVGVRDSVGDAIYHVNYSRIFESRYLTLYFAIDMYMRDMIHRAIEDTA